MARRKLSDEDYMDIAVVALLRRLERVGRDRDVLNELTPREQDEVFQAEARGMDIIRGRRDDPSAADDSEPNADEVEVPATPDGRDPEGPSSAAARAFPALHLPDQTDAQPGPATTQPPAPGRAAGRGRTGRTRPRAATALGDHGGRLRGNGAPPRRGDGPDSWAQDPGSRSTKTVGRQLGLVSPGGAAERAALDTGNPGRRL